MTGVMKMMELESMAVEMPEVEGHPNRVEFRGVLTVIDIPSQKPPAGSGGKRVILTKKAAEAALPSLLGMAVDYAPSFDRHDVRRKVGVITQADIVGRNLEVAGYLYAKDFPEIVDEIGKMGRKRVQGLRNSANRRGGLAASSASLRSEGARLRADLARAVSAIRETIRQSSAKKEESPIVLRAEAAGGRGGAGLGMSFEVTNVEVVDRSARVWILKDVTFTGAAILRKDNAAYRDTWIELG
jgi:hypothetical protein